MTTQDVFDLFPIGSILPYAGDPAIIPNGWLICDGTNKTVNLVGRPPVGLAPNAALSSIGADAGSATHVHAFTQGQTTPFNSGSGKVQPGNNQGFDAASNPHNHPLNGIVTDPAPNLPLSTQVFFIQKVQ